MPKRSTPRKEELIARIANLLTGGTSWPEIAEVLTLDGFKNADGNPHDSRALRTSYNRWIKEKPGKISKSASNLTQQTSTTSGQSSTTTPDGPVALSETDLTSKERIVSGIEPGKMLASESGMTHDERPTKEAESSLTPELQATIRSFLEGEFQHMLDGIEVKEVQKSGRGGQTNTVKKSFSLPLDVWSEFEERFKGSILSNHVASALRVYLKINKGK